MVLQRQSMEMCCTFPKALCSSGAEFVPVRAPRALSSLLVLKVELVEMGALSLCFSPRFRVCDKRRKFKFCRNTLPAGVFSCRERERLCFQYFVLQRGWVKSLSSPNFPGHNPVVSSALYLPSCFLCRTQHVFLSVFSYIDR